MLETDGLLKLLRYFPEHDVILLTCMIEQSDGVEVCVIPGICTALCYVVFRDHESMIGDAMRIQNTTSMPDR